MMLEGSSALLEERTAQVRSQWAAASEGGGDGGAWLDGDAAAAVACDASVAPVVTGNVNPAALDELVRLCVQLDKLRHHPAVGDNPDISNGAGGDDPGTSGAAATQRMRQAPGRARPARTPRRPGKLSSVRSSAKPSFF